MNIPPIAQQPVGVGYYGGITGPLPPAWENQSQYPNAIEPSRNLNQNDLYSLQRERLNLINVRNSIMNEARAINNNNSDNYNRDNIIIYELTDELLNSVIFILS